MFYSTTRLMYVSKYKISHQAAVWLKLSNFLSQPSSADNFHERSFKVVATIFKGPSGAVWLRQGETYTPAGVYNLQMPNSSLDEPVNSPFCRAMKDHDWVFSTRSPEAESLGAKNALLPNWVREFDDAWLVLPLLTESDLLDFMILTAPEVDDSLTWEDLDLLKTV